MFYAAEQNNANDRQLFVSDLGQPLGAASLDGTGKVEYAQLPDGLLSQIATTVKENLSLQINGLTRTFTTTHNFVSGSTKVCYCGIVLTAGTGNDYTEGNANAITFSNSASIPVVGDSITIEYIQAA